MQTNRHSQRDPSGGQYPFGVEMITVLVSNQDDVDIGKEGWPVKIGAKLKTPIFMEEIVPWKIKEIGGVSWAGQKLWVGSSFLHHVGCNRVQPWYHVMEIMDIMDFYVS